MARSWGRHGREATEPGRAAGGETRPATLSRTSVIDKRLVAWVSFVGNNICSRRASTCMGGRRCPRTRPRPDPECQEERPVLQRPRTWHEGRGQAPALAPIPVILPPRQDGAKRTRPAVELGQLRGPVGQGALGGRPILRVGTNTGRHVLQAQPPQCWMPVDTALPYLSGALRRWWEDVCAKGAQMHRIHLLLNTVPTLWRRRRSAEAHWLRALSPC